MILIKKKIIQFLSPLFILGNNRSGTSLLRLMLHKHSKICIPPESHFFLWLEEHYKFWENSMLDSYINDLFKATKFETWNIDKEELLSFLKCYEIKSYAELNSLVYVFYAIKHNMNSIIYWGDKNSLWIDKLDLIIKHYPNAFFIHMIRDGRDIACSYRSLNKKEISSTYAPILPTDIEVIADLWKINVNSTEEFINTKIQETNKITILYEDLIKKPEQVLTTILSKISLQLEDSQLNYFKTPKEEIEPKEFLAWKEKLEQPLDFNSIGKFKNELTLKEIELFNNRAKSVLKKYNYL